MGRPWARIVHGSAGVRSWEVLGGDRFDFVIGGFVVGDLGDMADHGVAVFRCLIDFGLLAELIESFKARSKVECGDVVGTVNGDRTLISALVPEQDDVVGDGL